MDTGKILKKPIHMAIIQFFHENQASIDTPRGIATWIGEDRSTVQAVLEDLVKQKILTAHRAASTTGYSYTRDMKLISKVEKLLKSHKK